MDRVAPHPQIKDRQVPARRTLRSLCCLIWIAILCSPALSTAAQEPSPSFDQLAAAASNARDQGDLPQAIELYQQAVSVNPAWPDGWWYLGSLQYASNSFAPATDALSHYIALTPTAGPAFALRGLCEFELAQYPQSLDDLQHSVALGAANQPRNAGIILYHVGLLLAHMGRFEEALGQYTQMVKHGNADQDVISAIGLSGLRMPIFPKEIDPSQSELVSSVGHAASVFMAGDPTAAKLAFDDLFARYPTTHDLHYLYGYLLFATDPDSGITQFQDELAVSPDSAITHAMLAWAYGLRGDFGASLPNAQKAVAEDPSLPMGQLVLGRALVETGEMAAGLPHLEAVLSSEPQNLEAHLALAKAYSKLGRSQDARRERLECLALSGQGTPNATM
jgi:tetratricopeptide (TPR) repeat protein